MTIAVIPVRLEWEMKK